MHDFRHLPASFLLTLAAAALLLTCGRGTDPETVRPPDIVLVSLDTLRADRLGSYGYHRTTSPHLDALAAEGVVFDQFVSAGGGTLPVHVSMFTGLPPEVHSVTPADDRAIHDGVPMLAELLRARGYSTGAFTDGGFVQRKFGFDRGFDVFDQSGGGLESTIPKALAFLDAAPQGRPSFLFLHTYDAHSGTDRLSYDAPLEFVERFVDPGYDWSFDGCRQGKCASQFLAWYNEQRRTLGPAAAEALLGPDERRFISDLYDAGIAHLDHQMGRFFEGLQARGLFERGYLVILSDHGEELFEHGMALHHQSFEETARIPLIVRSPGGDLRGRSPILVTSADVMPTLLEIAAAPRPRHVFGRSFLPALSGRGRGHTAVLVFGGIAKVRSARWSLLVRNDRPLKLFDLRTDPLEQRSVLEQHPQVAEDLLSQYRRLDEAFARGRRHLHEAAPQVDVGLSREEIDGLRALGYLQ